MAELLTRQDLGISASTARRLEKRGLLTPVRVDGLRRVLYPAVQVTRLIEKAAEPAAGLEVAGR